MQGRNNNIHASLAAVTTMSDVGMLIKDYEEMSIGDSMSAFSGDHPMNWFYKL